MIYDNNASQAKDASSLCDEIIALEKQIEEMNNELREHPEPLGKDNLFSIVMRDCQARWRKVDFTELGDWEQAWYWCVQTHQGLIPIPFFYRHSEVSEWQERWMKTHAKRVRDFLREKMKENKYAEETFFCMRK